MSICPVMGRVDSHFRAFYGVLSWSFYALFTLEREVKDFPLNSRKNEKNFPQVTEESLNYS